MEAERPILNGEWVPIAIGFVLALLLATYFGFYKKRGTAAGVSALVSIMAGFALSRLFFFYASTAGLIVPEGPGQAIIVKDMGPSRPFPDLNASDLSSRTEKVRPGLEKKFGHSFRLSAQKMVIHGAFVYRTELLDNTGKYVIFEGVSRGRSLQVICNFTRELQASAVEAACSEKVSKVLGGTPKAVS